MKPIIIEGIFSKATTLVDGGWRVSFDTGENVGKELAELNLLRGERLFVVAMTEAEYLTSQRKVSDGQR